MVYTPEQNDSMMIWSLFFLLFIAIFTAYYAHLKGRNPFLWFFLGVFLGALAPLILLVLSYFTKNDKDTNAPTMGVSNPVHAPTNDSPKEVPLTTSDLAIQHEEDRLWYYLDQDHQQMGPVSVIALRELWNRGILEFDSYVWSEGMTEWQTIDKLPSLKEAITSNKS